MSRFVRAFEAFVWGLFNNKADRSASPKKSRAGKRKKSKLRKSPKKH